MTRPGLRSDGEAGVAGRTVGAAGRLERELHDEDRAGSQAAFHCDRAPQRVDDLPNDPEAEPEAADMAGGGSFEAFEDPGQIGRGDADSVIAHDQTRSIRLATDTDLDRVIFAVFDGVGEQIRDDLVDPHTVPSAHDRLSLDPHAYEVALGLGVALDDFANEPAEVDVLDVEAQ